MTRPQFVELDAWKADARAAKASADVELRKGYAGVFKADDSGAIRIRLTTGQRDRDRDTINPGGWRLENYRNNPVVLFGHDYRNIEAVMGRDTGLIADAHGLVGSPVFAGEDENPWAARCERLIRGGFLNAASIGMIPITWSYNEEERGVDFSEQDLLEYSIVPVPANPGALVEARSLGHDTKWIAEWATKVLDEAHGATGLWVPRSAIEAAYAEAKSGRLFGHVGIKGLFAAADVYKAEDDSSGSEAELPDGASGAGDGSGDPSGASSAPDPNAGVEPSGDDVVIELTDDAPPAASDDVIEIDGVDTETELRALIQDAVDTELGPRFTALTGRID